MEFEAFEILEIHSRTLCLCFGAIYLRIFCKYFLYLFDNMASVDLHFKLKHEITLFPLPPRQNNNSIQ